jgi:S1-C subfamily serine protease
MWKLSSAIATLTVGLSASVAIAAGPFGSIHVGNWVGGAFTDDRTDTFSHCSASSEDQDRNSVAVEERSNGAMSLSFGDAAWHLRLGERFPVAITFDDRAHFQVSSTATADAMAESKVPNKAFLAWFMKSHLMIVRAKNQALHWRLISPDTLLATIANCVDKMRTSGTASAGDFSVPTPPVPATKEATVPITAEAPSAMQSQVAMSSSLLSTPATIAPGSTPTTRSAAAASPKEPTTTGALEPLGPGSRLPIPQQAARSTFSATEIPPTTRSFSDLRGAGFVIDSTGYIITANHVVSRCEKGIQGDLSGEGDLNLQLILTDETNDLALLRTQKKLKHNAMLRETAVLVGDPVLAFGYSAQGLPYLFTATWFVSSLSGNRDDSRFLQISLPTRFEGEGGGPLLDTEGNIVGLMTEGVSANRVTNTGETVPENVAFALKSGALRNFLDNSPVAYQVAEGRLELDMKQIVDRVKAYTVLVTCTAGDNSK